MSKSQRSKTGRASRIVDQRLVKPLSRNEIVHYLEEEIVMLQESHRESDGEIHDEEAKKTIQALRAAIECVIAA